jgi:hypothetical protein
MWTGNSRIMKPPNKWIQAVTFQPVLTKSRFKSLAWHQLYWNNFCGFLHPTSKYWNCALNYTSTTSISLPFIIKSFHTIQPEILIVSLNRLDTNKHTLENMFIHALGCATSTVKCLDRLGSEGDARNYLQCILTQANVCVCLCEAHLLKC